MSNQYDTNEAADGQSVLTDGLGVTEQEAFQWWKTEQDEAGYKQSEIAALAWVAACKWQRENAATAIEENCHMFFTDKACASLAKVVREQIRP